MNFNIGTCEFSENEPFDWLIWEDPSEHIMLQQEKYSKCLFFTDAIEKIQLQIPVSRFCEVFKDIDINKPYTVLNVVTQIKDFYGSDISYADFQQTHKNVDDDYCKDARSRFNNNQKVTYFDLMGTKGYGPFCSLDGKYKNPFLCNGCVRFEGFDRISEKQAL